MHSDSSLSSAPAHASTHICKGEVRLGLQMFGTQMRVPQRLLIKSNLSLGVKEWGSSRHACLVEDRPLEDRIQSLLNDSKAASGWGFLSSLMLESYHPVPPTSHQGTLFAVKTSYLLCFHMDYFDLPYPCSDKIHHLKGYVQEIPRRHRLAVNIWTCAEIHGLSVNEDTFYSSY